MSRADLAECANRWLAANTGGSGALDAHALARYERGAVVRPNRDYRAALRAVLGATRDSELGFDRAETTPSARSAPSLTPLHAPLEHTGQFTDAPADSDTVNELRTTIHHLVALDGNLGGGEVAPLALRAFRRTQRILDQGDYRASVERDLEATAAELAEVAGWCLIDAGRFTEAHRVNVAALRLAAIAGDTSMEWFVLSNDALVSLYQGNPYAALRIARRFGEANLPNRVRALFEIRQARALAALESPTALDIFDKARSELTESFTHRDPPWTWWVDQRELAVQRGHVRNGLGHSQDALRDMLESWELSREKEHLRWATYITAANALRLSLRVGAWQEAERITAEILPMVGEVSSGRTENILRGTVAEIPRNISSTLVGSLEQIRAELD
ncbi:hypothetical protein CDG81_12780 [Actinopolyspora erythraea]|uniref:XRE family transcriptional regulator n=1 Tax=Actinopolyspora erythraea TaxID=414996 RepID=A0A099D4P7_9ACTN|nr:hypothetical protein [Actinopolyspora erythraea]ASU79017.1 hypothetical protein CDG81_12780 [Actinopolyspora erythraea]KGI81143.1 hypothetical protein IL38_12875 [Actinopolyspora erythraea]